MLYFVFALLLIFVTPLNCDSSNHTFGKPPSEKKTKPTPKIITETTHNYFGAFGGYLYYIPNTDGLGYAITGVDNSSVNNLTPLNRGLYQFPDQNASSGFNVGIEAQLGYDKMRFQADFSNWQNHNLTKHKGEGDCSSSLFNGIYYSDTNNVALWNSQINTTLNTIQSPLPLTYSYVDWAQRLSLFNLCIKADKLIGESFIIRPQIGALYAFSKENYTIKYYFDITNAVPDDMAKAKICSSQVSHSIGPKVGFSSLYYPLQQFALFGEFFCTPAANRFVMHTMECADIIPNLQQLNNTVDVKVFHTKHKNLSITPILELSLGLEADLHLLNMESKLIVAFDQKYLFSRNYIKPPDYNALYTPTCLSLQGLRVSASVLPFSADNDDPSIQDKNKSFLHPKFRRPTNKVGLSLKGEFVYPKARVEGLAYAVSGINFIQNTAAITNDCLNEGQVFSPFFKREFAYKAEINAQIKYADLDFGAELFIMPQISAQGPLVTFESSPTGVGVNQQAQPLWFQDFSSTHTQELFSILTPATANFLTDASSTYLLDFKKINGYFSNTFLLKDFLTVQLQYGLVYLGQDQSYDINYTYTIPMAAFSNTTMISIAVHNEQTLKGLGPAFKCKSTFSPLKFFAFYGSLELGAPYSSLKVESDAFITSPQASTSYWNFKNDLGEASQAICGSCSTRHKHIVPYIIGEGGVEFMIWGKEGINLLHFDVGYNIQAFLSNNFMQPITNAEADYNPNLTNGGYMNNSKGTIGLSGVVFRLGVKF
jgi:hypothetical protein